MKLATFYPALMLVINAAVASVIVVKQPHVIEIVADESGSTVIVEAPDIEMVSLDGASVTLGQSGNVDALFPTLTTTTYSTLTGPTATTTEPVLVTLFSTSTLYSAAMPTPSAATGSSLVDTVSMSASAAPAAAMQTTTTTIFAPCTAIPA